MNKFSFKDGLKLLALYAFLIALLALIYFFFNILSSTFTSSSWWQFLRVEIQKNIAILVSYLPQNFFWYFCALLMFGVFFFLAEDFINLFRGKKDEVKKEELNVGEQILEEFKTDYPLTEDPFLTKTNTLISPQKLAQELQQTTIAEEIKQRILKQAYNQDASAQLIKTASSSHYDREFSYYPVVYYWVSGILFFGILAELGMAYSFPSERKNLPMIVSILGPLAFYVFWMGKAATRRLAFDSKHLYLGDKKDFFPENDYQMMYYINSRYLMFLSVYKSYHFMVFRKKKCFVPFAYFVDRFFPSSSSKRQVVFLSPWKDEEGQMVSDALIVKKAIEYCEKNHVEVKYWPFEAQFFLIFIVFVLCVLAILIIF